MNKLILDVLKSKEVKSFKKFLSISEGKYDEINHIKFRIMVGYVIKNTNKYISKKFGIILETDFNDPIIPQNLIKENIKKSILELKKNYDFIPNNGTIDIIIEDWEVDENIQKIHNRNDSIIGKIFLDYSEKFLFIDDSLPDDKKNLRFFNYGRLLWENQQ